MSNPFDSQLDRNAANYQPLSPADFLGHTAAIYPARPAVVHGDRTESYAELHARCRRLASALNRPRERPKKLSR